MAEANQHAATAMEGRVARNADAAADGDLQSVECETCNEDTADELLAEMLHISSSRWTPINVQHAIDNVRTSYRVALRDVGQATRIQTPGTACPERMSETAKHPQQDHKSHEEMHTYMKVDG